MPPPSPPNCPEVYSWFSPDADPVYAWTCMPENDQPGQAQYNGCEVGCLPCIQDDPQNFERMVGISESGHRWLRPDNISESRDAYGRYPFILSQEPIRLPYPMSRHQISMVWAMGTPEDGGDEYWLMHICELMFIDNAPYGCGGYAQDCPDAGGFNTHMLRATCWWFTGYQYDWGPNTITCTGNYGPGAEPEAVPFIVGSLGQAAFATTAKNAGGAQHSTQSAGGCTPNFLALCLGKELTVPGNCNPDWDGPPEYFSSKRGIWDYLYLWQIAAQMKQDTDSPDQDQAAIAAKNAALIWLGQHQVDVALDKIDFSGNGNSVLDYWVRAWNDSGSVYETLEEVPYVVATWPNCRLRYSRHRVIVEWIPWYIAIRASIVLLRKDARQVCGPWINDALLRSQEKNGYYPLVRLEIEMRMAARAEFAEEGEHQLVRTWLPEGDPNRIVVLEIENREAERHPAITAPESIVYVGANGREFDGLPPLTVRWKGSLEALTRHAWADHFDHDYYVDHGTSTVDMLCCGVARGFTDVNVHAQASHPDHPDESAGARDRLYNGEVRIGVNPEEMCPA